MPIPTTIAPVRYARTVSPGYVSVGTVAAIERPGGNTSEFETSLESANRDFRSRTRPQRNEQLVNGSVAGAQPVSIRDGREDFEIVVVVICRITASHAH